MIYKLKDLIEFKTQGVNTATDNITYTNFGYKIVQAKNIAPYNITFDENNFIDENTFKRIKKGHKLHKGEILYTNIGSQLGNSAVYEENDEAIITWNVMKLISKKEIVNNYYLCYLLNYYKPYIKSLNTSSTMPFVSGKELMNIEFNIPNLIIQKKIIKILRTLEDKIKLNSKINDNLSKLSLTLFKEFIEQNKDSSVKIDLKDCVEKIGTGADAIQRAPIVDYDTGIRCIRVGDMTNNRKYYEWGFTEMTKKDFENYKLNFGDIVITRTAVNGITKFIDDNEKIVCNNGLIKLKVNNKYNPIYIYMCTKTKDFNDYIHRIDSETSVRPNMKVDYFTAYKIYKFSLEQQNEFCQKVIPFFKLQKKLEMENYNLEQLRDSLIPKLMNGKIDLVNIKI